MGRARLPAEEVPALLPVWTALAEMDARRRSVELEPEAVKRQRYAHAAGFDVGLLERPIGEEPVLPLSLRRCGERLDLGLGEHGRRQGKRFDRPRGVLDVDADFASPGDGTGHE